jgi:hypothetical protein
MWFLCKVALLVEGYSCMANLKSKFVYVDDPKAVEKLKSFLEAGEGLSVFYCTKTGGSAFARIMMKDGKVFSRKTGTGADWREDTVERFAAYWLELLQDHPTIRYKTYSKSEYTIKTNVPSWL